jgi:hypothetical protein
MLKIILSLGLFYMAADLHSAERRTIVTSNAKKYQVTQEEASKILADLKSEAAKNPNHQRPPLSEIAVFNGGTAAQEEPENKQAKPCWADETQFQEIQKQVLNPWMNSWKNKNISDFNKLLIKGAKVDNFATELKGKNQKFGAISYYSDWNNLTKSTVADYLGVYKQIDDIDLLTLKYTSRRDYRDEKLNMIKADLHIQYDFRGITKSDLKRNDRGPLMVTVAKESGVWKIVEIKNWGLESLTNRTPAFQDNTKVSGVAEIPEYQRLEAIRRGGYAIAVGDVNNDGNSDLFLGAFGPGKLMLGNKNGVFTVSNDSGLEGDTLVKSAVFADFNNDGLDDLLLTRFVPTDALKRDKYQGDILIYQNLGKGKFKKLDSLIANREPTDNAMPAAVGDFNGDGKLDFYVGFPGTKDFTTFGKLQNKEGIRAQGVYLNLGNFKFSENNVEDYNRKVFNKVTEHQRIYPHSSVAFDFDQDGDTDIMVIDDRGNISPAYQNNGKGSFVQAQQYIGVKTTGFGMGMASADIDNNGVLDLVFTNVNFTNKYRSDASCKSNWDHAIFYTQDHGLKFYYGMKKGQFAEATLKNGLFYAGEGLSGLEFMDYNNDGHQDLYVTNGLWTGTDKDQDLAHLFTTSYLADNERVFMESREDTQSAIMKVLSGFSGDLFTGQAGKTRPQLAGFQRNRMFRNKGDGTFIEVGYLEGIDSIADGYVVARADIDGDSKLDIILRNGDPGTQDVNFPAVQVYKNNTKEGNALRLKLISDTFKSDAIGASVLVTTNTGVQLQQLIANNGTAQSEKILHFGLGKDASAKKVVITWPNKKTTTLINVPKGLHTVNEATGLLSLRR